jgi:5-methylcytosine-specific restriction endonuclease McrA
VKHPSEELSRLTSLNKLSLDDLLKLKPDFEWYLAKKKEIDIENSKIDLFNKDIEQENKIAKIHEVNYNNQYVIPASQLLSILEDKLNALKLGAISQWLTGDCIKYSFPERPWPPRRSLPSHMTPPPDQSIVIKKTSENIALIEQHRQALKKLATLAAGAPSFKPKSLKPKLPDPANYNVSTIGGSQVRVYFSEAKLIQLNNLINLRRSELAKLHDLKARAATNEFETRKLAQPLRRKLTDQLSILDFCPYCGGNLSQNDAHLDHIHPVSKGGLSALKNLVFVCSSCNQQKRDIALRHFIKKKGFDAEEVHKRLDLLGKD